MLTYGELTCQRCGTTWYGPKCGIKYCKECRRMVNREKVARCNQKKQAEKESKDKTREAFLDIVRKADAEGLSYGHYCLKHGI